MSLRYPVFVFEKSFYNKIILKVLEKLFNFFQSLFWVAFIVRVRRRRLEKFTVHNDQGRDIPDANVYFLNFWNL